MHAVLNDRTAQRGAGLLVLERQHRAGDRVGGVEAVTAEVSVGRSLQIVGARARDRLHLHPGGAALRDVEHVRHDLELGDRLAADLRLAEPRAGHALRDLLAVEVELKLIVRRAGRIRRVVRRDALDHQRQLGPVPPLQRQLRHLAAVDIAGDLRRGQVDERRLLAHGNRFLERGHLHRHPRHRRVRTDEQLDVGELRAGEAGKLDPQFVAAGRQAIQSIAALLRGHRDRLQAGTDLGGGHGRAGQHALRLVDDDALHRRVLLGGERWRQQERERDQPT